MIDTFTGSVAFDDGLHIKKSTPLSLIKHLPSVRSTSTAAGRDELSAGVHRLGHAEWGVGTIFVSGKLHQIWLQYLNAPNVNKNILEMQNEITRKHAHDEILMQLTFDKTPSTSAPRHTPFVINYLWGSLSSVLDVRGVQALIVIEYH